MNVRINSGAATSAQFGGAEFPVPVGLIAEDLLGLEVERVEINISGHAVPS